MHIDQQLFNDFIHIKTVHIATICENFPEMMPCDNVRECCSFRDTEKQHKDTNLHAQLLIHPEKSIEQTKD